MALSSKQSHFGTKALPIIIIDETRSSHFLKQSYIFLSQCLLINSVYVALRRDDNYLTRSGSLSIKNCVVLNLNNRVV